MKVPGTECEIISECSFCDSFSWSGNGAAKCALHPKGIPEPKLMQSYPGLPTYDPDYCDYQSPVRIEQLRAGNGTYKYSG